VHYLKQPLIGLLLLMALASPTTAKQVDGLYDVAIPVTAQSRNELARATRLGLQTVLIRVSGSAEVVKQQPIIAALQRASSYIKQYRYEYQRATADSSEQTLVLIEYEQQLLDQLLRQSGQPLWSSNRPSVLLWLAIEDSGGRRFASREQDGEIFAAIEANARRRGLAVSLPDLDLQDMVALSVEDLWQLNEYAVKPASERYAADTLLMGRATKLTNGEWLGRWLYSYDQQQLSFDGEALTADSYLGAALDQVAEQLAGQYAVAPVNIAEGGLLMAVSGVVNFVDYAKLINYLESVAAIRHANVVSIDGDVMVVQLTADGLLTQLQQSLLLGKQLKAAPVADYQGEYFVDLHYYWPSTDNGQTGRKALGGDS
jgi:hypothetical protein